MRAYTFERDNLSDLERVLDNFLRDLHEDRVFSVQYSATVDSNMMFPCNYSAIVILKEN